MTHRKERELCVNMCVCRRDRVCVTLTVCVSLKVYISAYIVCVCVCVYVCVCRLAQIPKNPTPRHLTNTPICVCEIGRGREF